MMKPYGGFSFLLAKVFRFVHTSVAGDPHGGLVMGVPPQTVVQTDYQQTKVDCKIGTKSSAAPQHTNSCQIRGTIWTI